MAINLAKMVQLATRTAANVAGTARSVTLVRLTLGALDPVTDKQSSTSVNHTVKNASIGSYRPRSGESFEEASLRITNNSTLTFAALDCPVVPAMTDKWVIDGETWTTTFVDVQRPGGVPLSYAVGLTK